MSTRKKAETASGSKGLKPWMKNLIFALVILVLAAALYFGKNPELGWFSNDYYVVSGIIHVLSGGIYVTVWNDKDKEWHRIQLGPHEVRLSNDKHEFEPGEYVRSKELSELFEKIKEYKESKTMAKRGDNG